MPVVLRVKVDPPLTVPPKVISPLPAEIVAFAFKTIGVPESPIDIAVFVDWTVPAILTWLGAVAVTPPVNVILSPEASPSVTVPVFENVTALVMVPPALIATL